MAIKTVLITGITGKSGQYLLHRMLTEKERLHEYRFILLCRKRGDYSKNTEGYRLVEQAIDASALDVEVIEADLMNQGQLVAVFADYKVDTVLHIADVKLSPMLVKPALEHGVNDFILVHTSGIYSKYKADGELYRRIEAEISAWVEQCCTSGRSASITILRPTMVYGDLNDKNVSVFIRMVDKLRVFPVINGGHCALQPIWCKDLGDAYFEVLLKRETTRNKEYILSGAEPIELRQIFDVIAQQLGVKNVFVSVPFSLAFAGAYAFWVLSFGRFDLREKIQRMIEPRAYSHEEAYKDFGFSPERFENGVLEEVTMYMRRKKQ